jgi:type IV secretion system protein VirD4
MYRLCRLLLILTFIGALYCGALLVLRIGPCALVGVVGLCAYAAKLGRNHFTAYGTARWADSEDLRKAGIHDAKVGLLIGRIQEGPGSFAGAVKATWNPSVDSREACKRMLRFCERKHKAKGILVRLPNVVHAAVFAPTGVGKGASIVIPHLLTCSHSSVVMDFKGENARLTAGHRCQAFGHRIVMLDPFRINTQNPDTWNPLDFIDPQSPDALDECRDLAEALVVRTGQEKDPHWCDVAEVWIAAMIAVVVFYGDAGNRSLQTVRSLLTNPVQMEAAIKLLCESELCEGMLSRLGHQLTHFKDKELSSTLTTANRFLRFLDTLAVASSTRTSSFDPVELRQDRTTIYLVLPPDHMRAQSPLLRVWISGLLRAVVRGGLQEEHRVHFILDEAASLGKMDAIDDAVDKFRGYGIRLQFIYQSLGQLKKCFPEGQDQTLLSNVTQVFFGVNDPATAEYVSGRLGEGTIVISSGGASTSGSYQTTDPGNQNSRSTSWSNNDNWQQHGRRLLKPEEVMQLTERTVITFTPGLPPLMTTQVRYYEESLGSPGLWERSKVALWSLMVSVILFVWIAMMALALSASVLSLPE